MASITFTGNQAAANGTSLAVLQGMAALSFASSIGSDLEGWRLVQLGATNGGDNSTRQTANLGMIGLGDGSEIVTSLTATAVDGTTSQTILTASDIHFAAQFDSASAFNPANLIEFQRVLDNFLMDDDIFTVSGAISLLWGDRQTIVASDNAKLGDDIFTLSGVSLATAVSQITVYGDAQSVSSGARCRAGDDVIDAARSNVSTNLYGDFLAVNGTATYGNDNLYGGGQTDFLHGDADVNGQAGGNDYLFGNSGDDFLYGSGGNDFLTGGDGADYLDGGSGFDVANYQESITLVSTLIVDLVDDSQNTNRAAGDTLIGIEGIRGRRYEFVVDDLRGNGAANTLWGLNGDDILTGRGGADKLYGGPGSDRLFGGAGKDLLAGGSGIDTFVFNTALNATTNVDTINDFKPVDDTIELENAIMTALAATPGTLSAAAFFASASGEAHDRNDRILYETDTGRLFYDADGDGSSGRVLFARLAAGLNLSNADFEIV